MTQSPEVRLSNFATWVRRAMEAAQVDNGWTKKELSDRVGISRETLTKWARGDFSKGRPKADKVLDFANAIGADALVPFELLGWVKLPSSSRTTPDVPEPELSVALSRFLRDASVPEDERRVIGDMVWRLLAPYRRNDSSD